MGSGCEPTPLPFSKLRAGRLRLRRPSLKKGGACAKIIFLLFRQPIPFKMKGVTHKNFIFVLPDFPLFASERGKRRG
jgi:hypothetical protein